MVALLNGFFLFYCSIICVGKGVAHMFLMAQGIKKGLILQWPFSTRSPVYVNHCCRQLKCKGTHMLVMA